MLPLIEFALSNWRPVLYGFLAIAAALWLVNERHTLIEQGAEQERAAMEKANDEAMAKAIAAAKTVDACYAAHGYWDRSRGVCVGSTRR